MLGKWLPIATLERADQIIVMKEVSIAVIGTLLELMEDSDTFRQIYN